MTIFNSQRVNNDPNPILEAFREDVHVKGAPREAWCCLKYWDTYLKMLKAQGYVFTTDHIDHAQKVLTRLVNVYGGQND